MKFRASLMECNSFFNAVQSLFNAVQSFFSEYGNRVLSLKIETDSPNRSFKQTWVTITLVSILPKPTPKFARWLLASEPTEIRVLKTELTLEPIRADSLSFLRAANQILHLEFQTLPVSKSPMPLRMLDYSVRLKRQYRCSVVQVLTIRNSQFGIRN